MYSNTCKNVIINKYPYKYKNNYMNSCKYTISKLWIGDM